MYFDRIEAFLLAGTSVIFFVGCDSNWRSIHTSESGTESTLSTPTFGSTGSKIPENPACHDGQTYFPFTVVGSMDEIPKFTPVESSEQRIFKMFPEDDRAVGVRLDLCINDQNEAELMQAVFRKQPPGGQAFYEWVKPNSGSYVQGLNEALAGDTSKFYLYLPRDQQTGFIMKGIVTNNLNIVYYAEGPFKGQQSIDSYIFVFGTLENRDPFQPVGVCSKEMGLELVSKSTTFTTDKGKVKIDLLSCDGNFFSTRIQKWRSIKITDTAAPGDFANKEFSVEEGSEPKGFEYKYQTLHHNACTEYLIKLPYAIYSYTVKTNPGNTGALNKFCGGLIEGTPLIETIDNQIKFKYDYRGSSSGSVEIVNPPVGIKSVVLQ